MSEADRDADDLDMGAALRRLDQFGERQRARLDTFDFGILDRLPADVAEVAGGPGCGVGEDARPGSARK